MVFEIIYKTIEEIKMLEPYCPECRVKLNLYDVTIAHLVKLIVAMVISKNVLSMNIDIVVF